MFKLLLNPFEKFTEKQLFLFGILFLFLGSYIGFLCNANFDSILHISFLFKTTFIVTVLQNGIIILLLTLLLFGVGKIKNKKTRFIDVLNVSLIARIPFYLTLLLNINNQTAKITDTLLMNLSGQQIALTGFDYSFLTFMAVFSLVCITWFAYLLWNGFKTATNAKTNQSVIVLIVALLLANFASQFLIQYIG